MKFAVASAIFSLAALALALAVKGLAAPLALPVYVSLAAIDVALFVLGLRDAAAALDIAAGEWEAAELKSVRALLVVLFFMSIVVLGYLILAHVAPSVFAA
ncbi:hypothetical protein TUZN_0723 [Thermoproteus uzoniensis 768-20]|uniref:Uncharacterized protein n=1 Tax=Thermoproteus uzoniensis (strain 768-20) TaxID=999630 RepID=F2L4N5_THEU7|nr:hypothetical protein [Thermoproteus uzoniensis]AEA12213.1 hypothetical protein TUZN_0723 [Thermoproteus uzoniensis 768-20]